MNWQGLYIHIPYCTKACHYCDFHFSTNLGTRNLLLNCLKKEIHLKSNPNYGLSTVYFGGGTPSILSPLHLKNILKQIRDSFQVSTTNEITLEANPEDLDLPKLESYIDMGINRLSIGVQTFDDDRLILLNRNHTSVKATESIKLSKKAGFANLSLDLIFGIPNTSLIDWKTDLNKALELDIPHVSVYGLTIENRTVFGNWVNKGKLKVMEESLQIEQFELAHEILMRNGYEHYEVSNYAKPGFRSKHNSSYWTQKPYTGVGPGAHSYDGNLRSINISNNVSYIKGISEGSLQETKDVLSEKQKLNEYIMTRSRTNFGIDLNHLTQSFGVDLLRDKEMELDRIIENELIILKDNIIYTSTKGYLMADEIAMKLFYNE